MIKINTKSGLVRIVDPCLTQDERKALLNYAKAINERVEGKPDKYFGRCAAIVEEKTGGKNWMYGEIEYYAASLLSLEPFRWPADMDLASKPFRYLDGE